MSVRIEHRIGINAPAHVIWSLIYDLSTWSQWNPIYPRAEGMIRIGSRLDLTLALPGEAHRQIQPVVLEWVPDAQLHWRLSLMGGLVSNVRYLEIDNLGPENCIFSNGELFGGLLGPLVARQAGRSIRRGFAAMGEALKTAAEDAWRNGGQGPTSEQA